MKYIFIISCTVFWMGNTLLAQVSTGSSVPSDSLGSPLSEGENDGPEQMELEEEKIPGPRDYIELEREPQLLNQMEVVKLIGRPGVAATEYGIGRVLVRVLVDQEGKYVKHILLRKVHPDLDQAVVEHLPACKFSPGIQGGKPLMCWITIPFAF